MLQYVDKSALIAEINKDTLVMEIEKCYNECLKRAKITDSVYWNAKADAYRNVLVILNDTLEVKEVNNEKIKWSPSKKQVDSLRDMLKYNDELIKILDYDTRRKTTTIKRPLCKVAL